MFQFHGLRFEWDEAKAEANLRKHGVSFDEASTAFDDTHGLVIPDPEHSVGEERAILLGLSVSLRVLVVVFSEHEDGDVIRIISARKADRGERQDYAAQRPV